MYAYAAPTIRTYLRESGPTPVAHLGPDLSDDRTDAGVRIHDEDLRVLIRPGVRPASRISESFVRGATLSSCSVMGNSLDEVMIYAMVRRPGWNFKRPFTPDDSPCRAARRQGLPSAG